MNLKPTWAASIQQINVLLSTAKETVIVTGTTPNLDNIAAALSLCMSLKKIGRRAHVICPADLTPIKSQVDSLRGADQMLPALPGKQLSVVIDYKEGTFSQGKIKKTPQNLTLELLPEAGAPSITPLNIQSNNLESKIDTAIFINIPNPADIQKILPDSTILGQLPIINIDAASGNTNYGKVNLIDTKASSMSEMTALLLYDLRLALDEDIAFNLYEGMKSKTDNLNPNHFSANLLEAASICLRYQRKTN